MTKIVNLADHRASPPARPRRQRRIVTEKAESAFAGFELCESALRQTLAEYLPFSGLVVTPEEVARLRAIADEINLIAARVEARTMPEGA